MRRRNLILVLSLIALTGALAIAPGAAGKGPMTPSGAPDRSVFLRSTPTSSLAGIIAVSTATGHVLARLPLGVADAGWSVLYAAATADDRTTVTAYDPRSGAILRQLSLAGSFALPVVVPGGRPEGLSTDGRTLVLVDRAPQRGSSRFAFLDTALASPPRVATLPGDFAFDALSPVARDVYLIEHLGGTGSGHYQVRLYDAVAGTLADGAIVDKRNVDEVMEGRPIARVTSADGQWVHTLYVKTDGTAFVHQLDTTERYALCTDLPEDAVATTAADVGAWRLAIRGTDPPYAANGHLGILVGLDLGDVRVTGRMATPYATGSDELAIAPDGQTLFLAGPDGMSSVSTGDLVAAGDVLRTPPLAGIAITPDGRWLYGVAEDGTGIVELEIAGPGVSMSVTVPFVDVTTQDQMPMRLLAVADAGA